MVSSYLFLVVLCCYLQEGTNAFIPIQQAISYTRSTNNNLPSKENDDSLLLHRQLHHLRRQQQQQQLNAKKGRGNNNNDIDDDGYSPVGSLSRQGPIPFFIRITQPAKYEEAVEKFMILEKCSRTEAQANMDAYFNDPTGWTVERNNKNSNIDYVNMNQDPSSLILTAVWGTISTFFIWRIYAYVQLGIDYKDNLLGF